MLDVHPEDITLLATEEDADRIIKHIRDDDEFEVAPRMKTIIVDDAEKEVKVGPEYYEDAENEQTKESWCQFPKGVREHLLPLLKASYLCTAQGSRKEFMNIVRQRIKNANMRKDPTYENYLKALNAFV